MGFSRVFLGVLSLACLICLTNGSAIKTNDENIDDVLKSASKTFGVKTEMRKTTHSNNGVVTGAFKQTQITTVNADAFHENAGNQEHFSNIENLHSGYLNHNSQSLPENVVIDHSSGQDDIAQGLLPLDEAKPVQFGARLGSNTKQSDCSVKGGCSGQISVSGGNSFDKTQAESYQAQLPQKADHHSQIQTTTSNFEAKNVENTQEQFSDQGQLQPDNVFGTNFDGQYEEMLRNLGQVDQFVDDINIPVVDTLFPEQGGSQTDFDVENIVPFVKEASFLDDQQQTVNPLDIGNFEQQSHRDSQDVSGVYVDPVVEQQNVDFQEQSQIAEDQNQARNFEFNQGSFQQQSGSSASVVDHSHNFGFQQNVRFQGTFAPPSQVSNEFQQQYAPQSEVSNENNNNFQDDTQDFFQADPIEALRYSLPGNPGEDYPILYKVPETSFQCNQQPFAAGIYGDMDAQCQVFHFCTESGGKNSFLCPNGTVFNQQYFVCDWWYNYNCSDTPSFYNLNAQLYWDFDNFEPTQIITEPGIESSKEQQINNGGEFEGQNNFNQFSGLLLEQEPFQTRVTQSGHSQTSTNQQVQSTVQQHGTNSFVEKRQDVSNVQSNTRNSFTQQSSSAQFTNFNQQTVDASEHDYNSHLGQTQASDFLADKKPALSVSVSETNSGSSNQQKVPTFQQNPNVNRLEETNVGGSLATQTQQNVNTGDFSVQDKTQHDVPSTSSDPGGWRPDSNSGTRYPDQSGYVQQHVDDQHKFSTNDQSISNVASHQTSSAEFQSIHNQEHITSHNQATQGFVPKDSSNRFNGQNGNRSPQSEIQQQHVQFPSDVSVRSDEASQVISQKEDFSTLNPENFVQQQNNLGSSQDVSFKRQAVFSSLNQDIVKQQEQSSFDGSEAVSDQPNVLGENIWKKPLAEIVDDQGSQSVRSGDVGVVNQEKQVDEQVSVDAFDGQQMVDAIQDAINYDNILDGFRSRKVAFMNVATTPEAFDINQRVYENRPAQVHVLSLQQNSNQDVNTNTNLQTPSSNFQQENINVDDIFSAMRGSPNHFQQQNGQQRLSFRPYGQNAAFGTNNNVDDKELSQNRVNIPTGNNEGSQQIFNQEIREQVIFPDEYKQRNEQNQRWQKTQNDENSQLVEFLNQQGINTGARNHNVNTPISQSHLNFGIPSNENLNVPNNDQHVQPESQNLNNQQSLHGFRGPSEHQNSGNRQDFENINNQQPSRDQRPFQNEDNQQKDVTNQQQLQEQHQFQNVNNQQQDVTNQQQRREEHQFQKENNQKPFENFNNQQQIQEQPHFENVNVQQHFGDVNTQFEAQNVNNQPQFPNNNNEHVFVQSFQHNVGDPSKTQNFAEFDSSQPAGGNVHQNQGVKGYHSQQNFRDERQGFNFPGPNPQTINANDAIIYSQNDPRTVQSAISYNGWKPIIRY